MGVSSICLRFAAGLATGVLLLFAPTTFAAPATPEPSAEKNLAFADPLSVDSAMKAWVRRALPGRGGQAETRLRRLATLMLAPDGLRLEEVGITTGAAEAFHQQQGNCVSFAFLFVALAREAGMPAFFVLSQTPEGSRSSGDLRVTDAHMAAAYSPRPGSATTVFDFGGKSDAGANFHRITDSTAIAVYLSNRGAELMMNSREGKARDLLIRAVEMAPNLSLAWVNLGVARRRLGDTNGAEQAFRRAIGQEPENLAAWRNLALLLESRSSDLSRKASTLGALNPGSSFFEDALSEKPPSEGPPSARSLSSRP